MRKKPMVALINLSLLAMLAAQPALAQTDTDQSDDETGQESGAIEEVIVT